MSRYADIEELLRREGVEVCLFSVSYEQLLWAGSILVGFLLGMLAIWLR